jgi:hypothetical protein
MANPVLPELARLAMMLTARQPNRDFMQAIPGEGGGSERAPTAFDAMSNAERAAYYSDNPRMAAATQFGQKAIGYAPFGIGLATMAQKAMFPNFVAEQATVARGIDPATGLQVGGYGSRQAPDLQSFDIATPTPTGLYGDQYAGMPAPKSNSFVESLFNSILPSSAVQLNPAPVQDRAPSLTPAGMAAAAPGVAEANIAGYDSGMGNFGGGSDSFGEGQYNQGGMVDAENLMGQAPGPDDGYGALQGGEYVIKKAAVDKYGQEMLDAINNGTFQFEQSLINFMATPAK